MLCRTKEKRKKRKIKFIRYIYFYLARAVSKTIHVELVIYQIYLMKL
jgi:hypothetical protein